MSAALELSREEWLEARRSYLTASDVAAVLGVDPRRGPLAVYESKVTDYSQDDNAWLKFGRDMEGAIANFYADKTGREVKDIGATVLTVHPDIPWLASTLDRMTLCDGVWIPLEIKNTNHMHHRVVFDGDGNPEVVEVWMKADEWAADPPLHIGIQVQTQIACADTDKGALTGMFPLYQNGDTIIDRDRDFFESAIPVLEKFWDRVQRREPPSVDTHKDLEVVKRLYPKDTGETVKLDDAALNLASQWNDAKERKKNAESEAKQLEAELRALIGDATFGVLPDGAGLSLKTTKRKAYTRTVEAGEYRTLRYSKAK